MAKHTERDPTMDGEGLPKTRDLAGYDRERGKVGWGYWRRGRKRAAAQRRRRVLDPQAIENSLEENGLGAHMSIREAIEHGFARHGAVYTAMVQRFVSATATEIDTELANMVAAGEIHPLPASPIGFPENVVVFYPGPE